MTAIANLLPTGDFSEEAPPKPRSKDAPWKRHSGEDFRLWLQRIAELPPLTPPPSPFEQRAIDKAPACYICGEPVRVTPGGRLEVVHDYRMHYPARVPGTSYADRPTRDRQTYGGRDGY